ncbi:MAG: ABC transporter permease [Eubacteriales bacterium]|nr:ABC transporter permease [Eubacteriales bacterium]
MPETVEKTTPRQLKVHYRGRLAQFGIYFGKMLRMFVYQSDWKVLPMAALIAGLVGMVIRSMLCLSMEGTLTACFALVMVCIWNGCFNSIQVICRERDVIKREHRSGMHISTYVASHMLYQAILCLLQTGVTLYVTKTVGVQYPTQGVITPWMLVDIGISMFLITYASDMMSLWVSSLSRNTTTAMTIMPFVLIFQLVFSGGMLSLPQWTKPLQNFTISNPGLKVLNTQCDYNNLPMVTLWNRVVGMWDQPIYTTVTLGQAIDFLQNDKNLPEVAEMRAQKISDLLPETEDQSYEIQTTIGRIINIIGAEKVKGYMIYDVRGDKFNPEYELTSANVGNYWLNLIGFALIFAALAMITLEFIDKDKR